MKKIFFSHPLGTYSTEAEDKYLELLKLKYPYSKIINPKYIEITEPIITPEDFRRVMEDYILPIVKSCSILAYYKDDSYAPGVEMEIEEATRLGILIVNLGELK